MKAVPGSELRNFDTARYGGTLGTNAYFRVYGKYFDRDNGVLANGSEVSDSWRMVRGGFRMTPNPFRVMSSPCRAIYMEAMRTWPSAVT